MRLVSAPARWEARVLVERHVLALVARSDGTDHRTTGAAVECGGLENRFDEGSNPSPSAVPRSRMIMRLLGRASRLRTEPPPSDRHVAVTESSCSSIAPSPLSGPVWSQLF